MARAAGGGVAAPREQWTGQLGFILSAIGSAVGLGNIWRFPGVAYENGGGAFLIPYLVALITAGIPILLLDYAVGHRFRGSAPLSFRRLGGRSGEALGWVQVAICFVIGLYYTVVVAWAASYFVFSIDLRWGDEPAAFFAGEYLQASDPGFTLDFVPAVLIPLVLAWLAVLVVLALGVVRGLQRLNTIALPLLFVGFIVLVVRALFLPGAEVGLDALFTPDFAALADPGVWMAAYSQIFFSLSVAFGIMVTYSSYRKLRSNLAGSGLVVAFANSSFEILAGVGVFATLGFFAVQQGVGVDELESLTGVGLSFITFPAIVAQMPGGPLFGMLFFGALAIAGFTSLVSVLQVVTAAVQEKLAIGRVPTAALVVGVSAVFSVLLFATTNGLNALDVVDNWANNVGVLASAVLTTILVVWVRRQGGALRYHLNALSTFQVGGVWTALVGAVVPVVLGAILITGVVGFIVDGYDVYDRGFLGLYGWGTIVVIAVLAAVLTLLPWRRGVGDFTAWPPIPPRADARKEAAR